MGLNIRLSARENAHLVDDSQPEYLIVPEAFSYKAEEALKLSTHQPKLIGIGDSHDFPLDYESQIEQHLMKGEFRQTPAEVIMLCYTTGSTGLPKGAVYEHDKLLRSIMYTTLCEFGLPSGISRDADAHDLTGWMCPPKHFHCAIHCNEHHFGHTWANPVHARRHSPVQPDLSVNEADPTVSAYW